VLQQANSRCEAVICLLSKHWLTSHECEVEFRYANTRVPSCMLTLWSIDY
jgi:hypothetical protein